ncbi:unnamed protein product [Bathycoccus prasinos]
MKRPTKEEKGKRENARKIQKTKIPELSPCTSCAATDFVQVFVFHALQTQIEDANKKIQESSELMIDFSTSGGERNRR